MSFIVSGSEDECLSNEDKENIDQNIYENEDEQEENVEEKNDNYLFSDITTGPAYYQIKHRIDISFK